jgi:hypothetical protein
MVAQVGRANVLQVRAQRPARRARSNANCFFLFVALVSANPGEAAPCSDGHVRWLI